MNNNHSKILRENLEQGDLKRLVHNELHIDEYKSKMGDDADVAVVSFKVAGKEPSADLVSFIEKGYDYVLDADVSSGEKEGGDYLVFVEFNRSPKLPEEIYQLMDDLMNLTEQDLSDWRLRYYKLPAEHEFSIDSIKNIVPLTPEKYRAKYAEDEEEEEVDQDQAHNDQEQIDQLKTAAGVDVTTTAPVNSFTESLRIAAGIR